MVRTILLACLSLGTATAALAQKPYDPYAPQVEEPPIGEDGKINWPPFYKAAATEAKYREYFKLGSCTGTRKEVTQLLTANKVDINLLPSASLSAATIQAEGGALAAIDADKKLVIVLSHPKGVSKISVSGEIAPEQVLPGFRVSGVGEVAANGRGVAPLEALHVVALESEKELPPLEPGTPAAFHAQVVKHAGNWIVLRLDGTKRRVAFELAPRAKIDVQSNTLDYVARGDQVQAKGRVYSDAGSAASRILFAEEITVVKHRAE